MDGLRILPVRTVRRGPPFALAAVLVMVAFAAWGGWIGRQTSDLMFYACTFAQAGLALAATRLALSQPPWSGLPLVAAAAVALRLAFLVATPNLSGDLYRYIWDGRVVDAGFNPYLHVPADPALTMLRDPLQYGLIDKRDYAVTIYPPVGEALFALTTLVSGSVVMMKTVMVLLEGAAVLAVATMLRRLGRPPQLIAAYLLHPAAVWEIAGNGHVDAGMMAFLFGAFAWCGSAARPYCSAVVMTLGALIKPTAALGLPALWRPFGVALPLLVAVVAVLCYLPFLSAGTGIVGFLPNYAREQGLESGQGFFLLALAKAAGVFSPWMSGAYACAAALTLVALALWTRRRGETDLESGLRGTAILVLAFLMLLTPVFPWYFLVALPFGPLLGLWSPFALSSAGFLLYGFNADAPGFLVRWSVLMAATLAAVAVDMRRGGDLIHGA